MKVLAHGLFVISLILFTGCANIPVQPPFDGTIKSPGNSIIVIDVVGRDSGAISFKVNGIVHSLIIRNSGLNYLELPPGIATVEMVNIYNYRFKPILDSIELKPDTVHYLGDVIIRFDFDRSVAGFFAVDSEKSMKEEVAQQFPGMMQNYQYEKTLLTNLAIDYGTPADYNELDIPKPTDEYAVLVIYRHNSGEGDWVTSSIHIDDTRIVGLEDNDYTWIKIKPGEHELKAHLGLFQHLAAQRKVTLQAGTAYFYHFGYSDIGRGIFRMTISEAVEKLKTLDYDAASMEVFQPVEKKTRKKN